MLKEVKEQLLEKVLFEEVWVPLRGKGNTVTSLADKIRDAFMVTKDFDVAVELSVLGAFRDSRHAKNWINKHIDDLEFVHYQKALEHFLKDDSKSEVLTFAEMLLKEYVVSLIDVSLFDEGLFEWIDEKAKAVLHANEVLGLSRDHICFLVNAIVNDLKK